MGRARSMRRRVRQPREFLPSQGHGGRRQSRLRSAGQRARPGCALRRCGRRQRCKATAGARRVQARAARAARRSAGTLVTRQTARQTHPALFSTWGYAQRPRSRAPRAPATPPPLQQRRRKLRALLGRRAPRPQRRQAPRCGAGRRRSAAAQARPQRRSAPQGPRSRALCDAAAWRGSWPRGAPGAAPPPRWTATAAAGGAPRRAAPARQPSFRGRADAAGAAAARPSRGCCRARRGAQQHGGLARPSPT